jgi:hypothetical protein
MNYVGNIISHVENLNDVEKDNQQVLKKKYDILFAGFANIQ